MTEEMLRIRSADGPRWAQGQVPVGAFHGAVVGKAILATADLAAKGMRIGMGRRAATRLVPHMANVNPRVQPMIGFQKAGMLALAPLDRLLDDGQRLVGIPGQAPAVGVFLVAMLE